MTKYKVRDLGKAEWILGIKINYKYDGILLNQQLYIEKILEKFNMSTCKSMNTPMVEYVHNNEKLEDFTDNTLYRQAIGSLLFLSSCTRPDITYAVSFLSRYVEMPKQSHWIGIKRILRNKIVGNNV